MENINITLLQTDLFWENREANLASLEEKIWKIDAPTDLILLPEMFTTGFSMRASALAEPMNHTTFKWLKQMAAQTNAVVAGTYIVQENGNFYNRLVWMLPNGTFEYYDKRHLFRLAGETEIYTAGQKISVVEWRGWKFCLLTCYDLRFPVWSRNVKQAYDCLIYLANWPSTRIKAWNTLLKARAIENLAYCVGVNRCGTDEKGLYYSGDSAVINPKGDVLFWETNQEAMPTVSLSKIELLQTREKLPFYVDADDFEIKF